jgi:hypothetical protein
LSPRAFYAEWIKERGWQEMMNVRGIEESRKNEKNEKNGRTENNLKKEIFK